MSIDLNWETLTSGPDGDALAERIRSFIHDKFQTMPLPRFIRSVNVHGFDFGATPPELELKDITDPLPEFYDQEAAEDESDDDFDSDSETAAQHYHHHHHHHHHLAAQERARHALLGSLRKRSGGLRKAPRNDMFGYDFGGPFLGTSTPGILGGPGLNYFQSHLGTGTHTPLAAVAGAHLGNNGWMGPGAALEHSESRRREHRDRRGASHRRDHSAGSISVDSFSATTPPLRKKGSVSTLAPTSANTSRPPTRDALLTGRSGKEAQGDEDGEEKDKGGPEGNDADEDGGQKGGTVPKADDEARHRREPRPDDIQAVFRIRYAGDIRLQLAAEILLDYPMPSFVGIPLKLNITGLSFDGVGVLAKIRKRVHFCFLSPDDALAAVGSVDEEDSNPGGGRFGGLLQEIKVESEIGERDGGKQSLKNVGKVERFVLEQVRRIFEEEFVYPSSWTFLV